MLQGQSRNLSDILRQTLGVIKLVKLHAMTSKLKMVEDELNEILEEDLTQTVSMLSRLFTTVSKNKE